MGEQFNGESKAPQQEDAGIRATATTDVLLEKFADRFEKSARRWEMVVYPALFAFVILAGYGFFLVYSLTKDMHTLSRSMDKNMSAHMESMTNSIASLAKNVAGMTDRMNEIALNIESMDVATTDMNGYLANIHINMIGISGKLNNLDPMVHAMGNMDQSMRAMTANTGVMTYDINQMQKGVKPMSFMGNFMPWR